MSAPEPEDFAPRGVAIADLLDAFSSLRVTVVGDAMLDGYVEGSAERVCREAPAPVVTVSERRDAPGGAANTASAVAALGAAVELVSVVGEDADGQRLLELLEGSGVGTDGVVGARVRRTIAKRRLVAGGQMLARMDDGTTSPVDGAIEAELLERLRRAFASSDAVIVSDYRGGVLTPAAVGALRTLQAAAPRPLVADGRDLGAYREVGVTVATPSYEDAMAALGRLRPERGEDRAAHAARVADRLLDLTRARVTVVTLDQDGALLLERGRPPHRTYARRTGVAGSAGAGDTFAATLALGLAAGAETTAAAEVASAAASVAVAKPGTAACSAGELRLAFAPGCKLIDGLGALAEIAAEQRARRRRIVFTNGCFDILHRGHIAYLNEAKGLGDVLVVGVNDDDSVTRLKGPDRPVNRLGDRVQVLAALSCVDHIVPFAGDRPVDLIETLRPDLYAKGGDYTEQILPEAPLVEELGGEVVILPYVRDRSTSRILDELRLRRAQSVGGS